MSTNHQPPPRPGRLSGRFSGLVAGLLSGLIGGLLSGSLMACQPFSGAQAMSGALSLAVQFPEANGFQIQAVAPETRAIYVMVYGNGQSLDKPQFWGPLTRFNPRMMVKGVPIGPQNVVVAAYDAQSKLISAAQETVNVQSGTRTAVTADLQPDPTSRLRPEALRALASFQPQIPPEPCGFSASGLQVAVNFPAFRTQLLKPETRAIYLVVYGTGLTLENPAIIGPIIPNVTPNTTRVMARHLPLGKQIVLTVAVDAEGNFLTGDRQEVEIQTGQRANLSQDLREDFESSLSEAERARLKRLTLPQLQRETQLSAEMSQPICPTPTPTPAPLASESPSSQAPEPVPPSQLPPSPSEAPLPTPSATPLPSPSPILQSSGGGGGGDSSPIIITPTPTPTPTGASLDLDVNITNGTVGIPPITAF